MVGHPSGRVGRRRLHLPVGRLLQARRGGHRRGGAPHQRLGRHRRRLPPHHLSNRTGRIPTGADLAFGLRPTPKRRRVGALDVGVAVHRQPTQGHDLRPRARRPGPSPPHAPRRQGEVGQERGRLARGHLRLRVGAALGRSRTARRDPASRRWIPRAVLLIGIDRGAPGALRSGRLAGAASCSSSGSIRTGAAAASPAATSSPGWPSWPHRPAATPSATPPSFTPTRAGLPRRSPTPSARPRRCSTSARSGTRPTGRRR